MNKHHELTSVKVSQGVLSFVVDGTALSRDLRVLSPILHSATNQELEDFDVSPSGYGIHWPRIDEDLSIDGLLGILHAPSQVKKSA